MTTVRTPPEINAAFLEHWKKVAAKFSAKDAFFKKVFDSQKKYAKLLSSYRLHGPPPYEFAAEYFAKSE